MNKQFMTFFFIFIFFSFCGWILEFVFRSWKGRRIINPGFLKGPYLPIYGTAAVLLSVVICNFGNSSFLQKIIIYLIITSGLEYLTGFVFEALFDLRLWDYSDKRFVINKHVCLTFSFYWLILAFSFEYIFLPNALLLYKLSPYIFYATIGIASLMFFDAFITFTGYYIAKHHTEGDSEDTLWSDFSQIIEPLLKNPQIASLSDFRHHRMTTRLDHCLEVAWLSYIIARRFSVDYTATVRGALLHDLFFYEWLTEGPRLHGFRHPRLCLENSRQLMQLSQKEEDIIVKHMWPLTFSPPRYIESWIVCIVDTYCTIKDYISFFRVWSDPDFSVDHD